MANICNNELYAVSNCEENINTIYDFFENHEYDSADIENYGDNIFVRFDSKWTFPESEMEELFDEIPNKEDIYMRCLSVEYGNLYHALWVCDEDGWKEV